METGVSIVLLNYNRPQNMVHIVKSIKAQTVPTEIILVDNGGYLIKGEDGADIVIKSHHHEKQGEGDFEGEIWNRSHNLGCYARLLMAHYAKHEYVVFLDDDLAIKSPQLFEDIIGMEPTLGCILGAYGRRVNFQSDTPYSGQPDEDYCRLNAVKGRFMFFHKSLLDLVPIGAGDYPYSPFNDDLYFSLMSGMGKAVHWVNSGIRTYLEELEPSQSGLSAEADHYQKRDAFCKWWWQRHGTPA